MDKIMDGLSGWRRFCLMIAGLVFLVGCGAGKTAVMKPPETRLRTSFLNVLEEAPSVSIPEDARKIFQEKLNRLLYTEGSFQRGSDLTLRYRFIQYDPGSQFTRWFWGGLGNAGQGSLTIEVKYFDINDKELAAIQAEGEIGSGFMGGAFDLALEKAANEIAQYTQQNFQSVGIQAEKQLAAITLRPEETEEVRVGVVTTLQKKYLVQLNQVLGQREDCELLEIPDRISYDKLDAENAITLKQRYHIDMLICVGSGRSRKGGLHAHTKLVDISGQRLVKLDLILLGWDSKPLPYGWEKKVVNEQKEPIEKMIEEIYIEKRKGKP